MLKLSLFLSNSCHSVHKSEISKFLARMHMKYFHMGISVILGVCLIRKYGSQITAFFCISGLLGAPLGHDCVVNLFTITQHQSFAVLYIFFQFKSDTLKISFLFSSLCLRILWECFKATKLWCWDGFCILVHADHKVSYRSRQ